MFQFRDLDYVKDVLLVNQLRYNRSTEMFRYVSDNTVPNKNISLEVLLRLYFFCNLLGNKILTSKYTNVKEGHHYMT